MTRMLEGKVGLVTGAGRGIGLATAKAFAEAGAAVVLADRDGDVASEAADGLGAAGHRALAVTCDIADPAQTIEMVAQTVAAYGRLDAAFNNAGVNSDSVPLLDTSDEEFERIISINLHGVWNCMKAELRQMTAQSSGAIVNCSSIGGMRGSKGRSGLLGQQARSYRPDAVGGARLCHAGNSHQCGLSRHDPHPDGC